MKIGKTAMALCLSLWVLLPAWLSAEVYKCDGGVLSDKPCVKGASSSGAGAAAAKPADPKSNFAYSESAPKSVKRYVSVVDGAAAAKTGGLPALLTFQAKGIEAEVLVNGKLLGSAKDQKLAGREVQGLKNGDNTVEIRIKRPLPVNAAAKREILVKLSKASVSKRMINLYDDADDYYFHRDLNPVEGVIKDVFTIKKR